MLPSGWRSWCFLSESTGLIINTGQHWIINTGQDHGQGFGEGCPAHPVIDWDPRNYILHLSSLHSKSTCALQNRTVISLQVGIPSKCYVVDSFDFVCLKTRSRPWFPNSLLLHGGQLSFVKYGVQGMLIIHLLPTTPRIAGVPESNALQKSKYTRLQSITGCTGRAGAWELRLEPDSDGDLVQGSGAGTVCPAQMGFRWAATP